MQGVGNNACFGSCAFSPMNLSFSQGFEGNEMCPGDLFASISLTFVKQGFDNVG